MTPRRVRSSTVLPERTRAASALVERAAGAMTEAGTLALASSEVANVLSLRGEGTVVALTARTMPLSELVGVQLRVFWDGETDAAIDAPILDFFASSLGGPPVLGSLLEADADSLTLRLPMPFSAGARFELENTGTTDVSVELTASIDVRPAATGRLHVERNETLGPTALTHHPLVDVAGAGRLAGVCLSMEGHALVDAGAFASPLNFLEGDERIRVDGADGLRGTGTED